MWAFRRKSSSSVPKSGSRLSRDQMEKCAGDRLLTRLFEMSNTVGKTPNVFNDAAERIVTLERELNLTFEAAFSAGHEAGVARAKADA